VRAGGGPRSTDSLSQNLGQRADGEAFPVSEVGLAKTLGVDRSVLKSIRKNLKKGVDWETVGKQVLWSQASALALAERLTATQGGETEKNALLAQLVNGEVAAFATLKVVKLLVNPHMVLAAQKNGEVVNVNVVHSRNFKRGMEFRAEQGADGHWRLVGRTPRYPGRW
jgi:hypothetical protein